MGAFRYHSLEHVVASGATGRRRSHGDQGRIRNDSGTFREGLIRSRSKRGFRPCRGAKVTRISIRQWKELEPTRHGNVASAFGASELNEQLETRHYLRAHRPIQ